MEIAGIEEIYHHLHSYETEQYIKNVYVHTIVSFNQ